MDFLNIVQGITKKNKINPCLLRDGSHANNCQCKNVIS